ncbi:MAG: hypothetical protein ACN0LA_09695 [Candidatus Longimicrobiales bacterium M2_2A_002]
MTVRDPVCGMCFEWEEARAHQRVGDAVVYFCCPGCAARFSEDPERYLGPGADHDAVVDCPPDPGRRSILSHGISATVPVSRLPRVGALPLDAFADRVQRACARPGRPGTDCRVLGRALLLRVLGWAEPHRISVRIAAEISILRHQCDDVAAALEQLAALPYAVAAASREAGLCGAEIDRLQSAMAREVAEARLWLDPPPSPGHRHDSEQRTA